MESSDYRQRLAAALKRAKVASKADGIDVIHTRDLSRADRELLVSSGWLQEIIKGWYLLLRPDAEPGDSTIWFAHFWQFLAVYLEEQYGKDYCLSAESSLFLHTRSTTIPDQVIVMVPKGGGKATDLPFNTSIFPYSDSKNIPKERVEVEGIQCMPLALALCRIGPQFYCSSPSEAEIALSQLAHPQEIVDVAVQYGLQRGVGRVIGAFDALDQKDSAQAIRDGLKSFGLARKEENPFSESQPSISPELSPYVQRIKLLWARLREAVMEEFTPLPEKTPSVDHYLLDMDRVYIEDAYHSLSIEGYRVTPDLVERVQNNGWDPDGNRHDTEALSALAARGYFEAFQVVKSTIQAILEGAKAATKVQHDLPKWYNELWAPSVRAGLLDIHHVRGYRRGPVFIRGSRHIPPPASALLDAMDCFFHCLQQEKHPAVRAVLGHYIFVFIHPYSDGNGRIGRFIMNAMLASGGYPWTVIRVDRRRQYIDALEHANIHQDIRPFTRFIREEMSVARSSNG